MNAKSLEDFKKRTKGITIKNSKNNNNQEKDKPQKNNKSKKYKQANKKQLANTCPTEDSEKEAKKQVGCAMLNLREKCGKNAEQLK